MAAQLTKEGILYARTNMENAVMDIMSGEGTFSDNVERATKTIAEFGAKSLLPGSFSFNIPLTDPLSADNSALKGQELIFQYIDKTEAGGLINSKGTAKASIVKSGAVQDEKTICEYSCNARGKIAQEMECDAKNHYYIGYICDERTTAEISTKVGTAFEYGCDTATLTFAGGDANGKVEVVANSKHSYSEEERKPLLDEFKAEAKEGLDQLEELERQLDAEQEQCAADMHFFNQIMGAAQVVSEKKTAGTRDMAVAQALEQALKDEMDKIHRNNAIGLFDGITSALSELNRLQLETRSGVEAELKKRYPETADYAHEDYKRDFDRLASSLKDVPPEMVNRYLTELGIINGTTLAEAGNIVIDKSRKGKLENSIEIINDVHSIVRTGMDDSISCAKKENLYNKMAVVYHDDNARKIAEAYHRIGETLDNKKTLEKHNENIKALQDQIDTVKGSLSEIAGAKKYDKLWDRDVTFSLRLNDGKLEALGTMTLPSNPFQPRYVEKYNEKGERSVVKRMKRAIEERIFYTMKGLSGVLSLKMEPALIALRDGINKACLKNNCDQEFTRADIPYNKDELLKKYVGQDITFNGKMLRISEENGDLAIKESTAVKNGLVRLQMSDVSKEELAHTLHCREIGTYTITILPDGKNEVNLNQNRTKFRTPAEFIKDLKSDIASLIQLRREKELGGAKKIMAEATKEYVEKTSAAILEDLSFHFGAQKACKMFEEHMKNGGDVRDLPLTEETKDVLNKCADAFYMKNVEAARSSKMYVSMKINCRDDKGRQIRNELFFAPQGSRLPVARSMIVDTDKNSKQTYNEATKPCSFAQGDFANMVFKSNILSMANLTRNVRDLEKEANGRKGCLSENELLIYGGDKDASASEKFFEAEMKNKALELVFPKLESQRFVKEVFRKSASLDTTLHIANGTVQNQKNENMHRMSKDGKDTGDINI